MISLSSGLIVWIFITSASIFCFSNSFAASKDSQTKCPVATIVTSFPGLSNIPFPILKPKSLVVKLGPKDVRILNIQDLHIQQQLELHFLFD